MHILYNPWKSISLLHYGSLEKYFTQIVRYCPFICFNCELLQFWFLLRNDMVVIYLIYAPYSVIICYFQNNRKRKQPTSSGPANSTGTGNTVGPSTNSPPSTPSTHTPGDGLGMAGNMRHVPKNLMMYGADGTGLASSSNQMVRAFTLNLKHTPGCKQSLDDMDW